MALEALYNLDSNIKYGIWKIEETAAVLHSGLYLKAHETKQLQSYRHPQRRLQWLATRHLLKTMLATTDYIDSRVDNQGKPFLANQPYQVSLSHADDYAAVILSSSLTVGIDIEKQQNKILRLDRKFLTETELSFIDSENRLEHLYACWCLKEAIYKCYGRRNISLKNNIKLPAFNLDQVDQSLFCTLQSEAEKHTFEARFKTFKSDYMLAYAVEH